MMSLCLFVGRCNQHILCSRLQSLLTWRCTSTCPRTKLPPRSTQRTLPTSRQTVEAKPRRSTQTPHNTLVHQHLPCMLTKPMGKKQVIAYNVTKALATYYHRAAKSIRQAAIDANSGLTPSKYGGDTCQYKHDTENVLHFAWTASRHHTG